MGQQPGWGQPPQGFGPPQGYYDPAPSAGWPQQGFGGPPQQGWPQQPPQRPQQQQAPRDTRSANDILMGGGGAPSWNFEGPGVRKVARITKPPQAKQEREYDKQNPGGGAPKFFPSGDPIMGVTVEVQTNERNPQDPEDDGKRTFYIEGKRLKEAVREAVRAAGAQGLEVGATLDVTLTHYDDEGDRKSGRNWSISYTLPGNNVLMDQPPQQQQAPQGYPNGDSAGQAYTSHAGQPQGGNGQQRYPSQLGNNPAPTQPPEWAQPQQDPYQGGMSPEQQAAYDNWQQGQPQ